VALPEEDSTAVVGDEAVALGGVAELAADQGGGELEEEAPSRAARRLVVLEEARRPADLVPIEVGLRRRGDGRSQLVRWRGSAEAALRPDLLKQVFCPSNTTSWEAVVSAGGKVGKAVASPGALRGMIGVWVVSPSQPLISQDPTMLLWRENSTPDPAS
jgi:hypothetical protein